MEIDRKWQKVKNWKSQKIKKAKNGKRSKIKNWEKVVKGENGKGLK